MYVPLILYSTYIEGFSVSTFVIENWVIRVTTLLFLGYILFRYTSLYNYRNSTIYWTWSSMSINHLLLPKLGVVRGGCGTLLTSRYDEPWHESPWTSSSTPYNTCGPLLIFCLFTNSHNIYGITLTRPHRSRHSISFSGFGLRFLLSANSLSPSMSWLLIINDRKSSVNDVQSV